MVGPQTEYTTKRIWQGLIGHVKLDLSWGQKCPSGWWLPGSGAWRSVLCHRFRFGDCQHLENPDAVMNKGVCVERTWQKASYRQTLWKPQAHGTGRGRITEQLGKDWLEEQEEDLSVEAGPPTKECFKNKGVVGSVRYSRAITGELSRFPNLSPCPRVGSWLSLGRADSKES